MLRIQLFGDFRVEVESRVPDRPEWRRGRVRSLAKLLALAPGKQLGREQILDTLWPELPPSAAANQLDKTVHFLRRALDGVAAGTSLVVVGAGRVGLPRDTWVDIDEFHERARAALKASVTGAIEQALAIADGTFLPENLYDAWADAPRHDVDALRRQLRLRLGELRLAAGEHESAQRLFEEILGADPADEPAHRGLMQIGAARRDWRAAIGQYQECRDHVWEELAVEPSPETEHLRQKILGSMLAASTGATDSERAALLEEMADALRQTGQAARAADLYTNAIALYEPTDDAAARRVHGKVALAHIVAGDIEAAEAHIGPIRDSLEREWPAYLTARTLYLLAQLRWHGGRYREALEAAERAVQAARATDDLEHQARAQEVLALACHALGDWRRGIEAELERQRIAAETGFAFDEVLEAHLCLWEYSLYGDRPFGEVEQSIGAALERAEEAGNVGAMAVAEHALGSVLIVVGRWPEARQALGRSLRLAKSIGAPQGTVLGLQRLALLETISGNVDAGHRRIEEAFAVARASSSAQVQLHSFSRMNATLAINRFIAGDVAAAQDALAAGATVQREAGECITCDSLIHPAEVPIRIASGEIDLAEEALGKTRATATSFRGASRVATAQHAGGLVAAARGDWITADRRLSLAATTFSAAGQPYEFGRSLTALAAVRRVSGQRDWEPVDRQAREVLVEGLGVSGDPDRVNDWLPHAGT